ncbi:MAG: hypothetical protein U0105_25460 [Candidatus Obscuribacterales bacterium]
MQFRILCSILASINFAVSDCVTCFASEFPSSGDVAIDRHLQGKAARRLHSDEQIDNMSRLFRAMSEQRTDDALALINSMLENQPIFPWLYACRARVHLAQGLQSEALSDANKAVEQDPGYDVCYGTRGQVLLAIALKENSSEKAQSAIKDLSEALRITSSRYAKAEYYLARAQCYKFLNDSTHALSDATKSLANNKTQTSSEFLSMIQKNQVGSVPMSKPVFNASLPDWHRLR